MRSNRFGRQTLPGAALLGPPALALAACGPPAAQTSAARAPALAQQPASDVLIVGAGVAGLAAGAALRAAGADVRLIEARGRVGGRVWTDTSLGAPLDMGAAWVHGVRGNPLSELVRRGKIATAPTDYENLLAYDAAGDPVDDARHARIDAALDELVEAAEELRERRQGRGQPDIALLDAFAEDLPRAAGRRRELDYAINTIIEHEYAADVGELSLFHYDAGFGAFGGGDVLFPGGYGQIVSLLAAGLDLELGAPVAALEHGSGGVLATLADGRTLRGRRAIVTLPLGVLKAGAVRFAPELPAAKAAALGRMGSGALNKLYLRFPRIFWDNECELLGYIGERKGEWAEFINLAYYTGEPILLGFNAARYGRAVERLDDAAQAAAALAVLRTIYGPGVPQPTAVKASRWVSDPYARGAYSFVPPGGGPADHAALAAPVGGALFFAGEHTSAEHPSTVHGALLSGRRAAAEILALA